MTCLAKHFRARGAAAVKQLGQEKRVDAGRLPVGLVPSESTQNENTFYSGSDVFLVRADFASVSLFFPSLSQHLPIQKLHYCKLRKAGVTAVQTTSQARAELPRLPVDPTDSLPTHNLNDCLRPARSSERWHSNAPPTPNVNCKGATQGKMRGRRESCA